LDWNENLVTHWSKGQPHFTPRPVDWEEFEVINKANDGQESFLVEGVSPLYKKLLKIQPKDC
jgi:hypothetical protein